MLIESKEYNITLWRWCNLISIMAIIIALLLLVFKILYDSNHMASPLLPKYTVLFMNGGWINLVTFLIGSLIPALFLRSRQWYIHSTICILLFFVVGLILKDSINIYEHFYGLSKYLG